MKDLKLFSFKMFIAFAILLVLTIWHNNTKSFKQALGSSNCIFYDPSDKVITVKCKIANLRDIDNQLKDPNVLQLSLLSFITGVSSV
jgi:hypothetical protein